MPGSFSEQFANNWKNSRALVGAARFDSGKFELAARLFEEMSLSESFPEFLTVPAYDLLD